MKNIARYFLTRNLRSHTARSHVMGKPALYMAMVGARSICQSITQGKKITPAIAVSPSDSKQMIKNDISSVIIVAIAAILLGYAMKTKSTVTVKAPNGSEISASDDTAKTTQRIGSPESKSGMTLRQEAEPGAKQMVGNPKSEGSLIIDQSAGSPRPR